ncbi:MAG: TRAP transporter small permease [bacterium]|nr:TRAP transporter small permease [bacterium]
MLKKILRFLDWHVEEIFLLPALAYLVVSLGVEVFRRYVLKLPSPYTSEISTYVFLWIVYLGVPYAIRRNKHITLDFLPQTMSPKINCILLVLDKIIVIAFCVFFIPQAVKLMAFNHMVDMRSDAMGLPIWIVLICFPLGFGLGIIRLIQSLILSIVDYRKTIADGQTEEGALKKIGGSGCSAQ